MAKDSNRKGELFGLENLLKFKDGSFMSSLWKSTSIEGSFDRNESIATNQLAELMRGNEELIENNFCDEDEEVDQIQSQLRTKGYNHEDFMREDRGHAVCHNGEENIDEGFGETQLNVMACESACSDTDDEEEAVLSDTENVAGVNISTLNARDKEQVHSKEQSLFVPSVNVTNATSNGQGPLKSDEVQSLEKETKAPRRTRLARSLFDPENFRQQQAPFSSTLLYRPAYLDHKST